MPPETLRMRIVSLSETIRKTVRWVRTSQAYMVSGSTVTIA